MLSALSACGSSAGSTNSEPARVGARRTDTETSGPAARASDETPTPSGEVAQPGASGSPRAVSATAPSSSPSGEVTQPASGVSPREVGATAPGSSPSGEVTQPASGSPREVSATGPSARAVSAAQALAEVRALVDRGSIGAARALAEHHLQAMPLESPEARQIMSLTGVHPHP
jgi:hypothetical protein